MRIAKKSALTLFLIGLSFVGTTAAVASDHTAQENAVSLAALPPGAQLQELKRYFRKVVGAQGDHMSGQYLPYGYDYHYKLEGTLAFTSSTWFPNSHLMYSCILPAPDPSIYADFFTSTDENCEGRTKFTAHPTLGYVSSTQIEGTVPLIRCLITTPGTGQMNHYDAVGDNCGNSNAVKEGVLGYVFL
jgi:hypothetical protein